MNEVKLFLNLPEAKLKGVKRAFAVWSAKGGVGKTTVASAFAKVLSEKEDTLLIDADITNPNVYDMFGLEKKLYAKEGKIVPATKDKLKIISMQGISTNTILWRGPLISQAIEELLEKTELSRNLVIDMPPGTSDVAITIAQKIRPKIILVSTPQKEALSDLKKTIGFCRTMNLQIVGLIENMSGFFGTIDRAFFEQQRIKKLGTIELSKEIAQRDFSRLYKQIESIVNNIISLQ